MSARLPEMKELVRGYLVEHGPSRPGDIYEGIPGIRKNYTRGGFNSRLHDMHFVHQGGFVLLQGQALDAAKLQPPYVLPLLRKAENSGVSPADIKGMTGDDEAKRRLNYLINHGLFARKRTFGPAPVHIYELTEKGKRLKTEIEKKLVASELVW